MEIDISKCEFSELVDGSIRIAIERFGGGGSTLRTMQPLGLIARPRDPDPGPEGASGDAANALYLDLGGDGFVMPLLDPRFTDKVPPVKKGGVALYSAPGGILNFDGDDGTMLLLTPATNGASHVLVFDNPNDAVQMRHARGHGLSILGDGSKPVIVSNAGGDAFIMVHDGGVLLNGNTQCVGSVVVGNVEPALPEAYAAVPVALAPAWLDWANEATILLGKIVTAVNVIAAGAIPLSDLALVVVAQAQLASLGQSLLLTASPLPKPPTP